MRLPEAQRRQKDHDPEHDCVGGDGERDKIAVGRPFVQGAGVSAEVVDQLRGPKLRIFKYKRRNDYRKRRGHRDTITRIRITGIKA